MLCQPLVAGIYFDSLKTKYRCGGQREDDSITLHSGLEVYPSLALTCENPPSHATNVGTLRLKWTKLNLFLLLYVEICAKSL